MKTHQSPFSELYEVIINLPRITIKSSLRYVIPVWVFI